MKLRVREDKLNGYFWLERRFLFIWHPVACSHTKEGIYTKVKLFLDNRNHNYYYHEWDV